LSKAEAASCESIVQQPVNIVAKEVASKQETDTCLAGLSKGGGDDLLGTAVHFLASPKVAGEEALKSKKLLFILHVSGNFEDPGFT
jgi:hypothetical protein